MDKPMTFDILEVAVCQCPFLSPTCDYANTARKRARLCKNFVSCNLHACRRCQLRAAGVLHPKAGALHPTALLCRQTLWRSR